MNIENMKFIQNFKKITSDAWLKGWHERNGGNISYRLTEDEVTAVKGFINKDAEYTPIGVTVKNLANEYFLVTGSGKFIRNMTISLEENAGIIKIDKKGENYKIVWGLINGARPTSEVTSHLMSHSIKKEETNGAYREIGRAHV